MNTALSDARTRLMLVLPSTPGLTPEIADMLTRSGDVAAVIMAIGEGAPDAVQVQHLHALAAPIQAAGAAVLVQGWTARTKNELVDGGHLRGLAAFKAAVSRLKPDLIAGAGGLDSRHEAMEVGEAGADYVLFGDAGLAFPEVLDLVSWWVDLFEVPCVGIARDQEEALALARAGADFVALAGDWLLEPQAGAMIADLDKAIRQTGTAQ